MIAMSASSAVPAQEPTGAVEGTVTDPQGAVVQNASVTARSVATNFVHTVTTGDDGHYRIAQLLPGNYEVKVTLQGFKSTVVSNVKVEVGTNVPLDVTLEVGGVSEQVNVIGGGEAQVDRTDHTVSGVVGTLQIESLPLNGRNFLDLARLQPGTEIIGDAAIYDPTKTNYFAISLAGQQGRATQITVDGGSVVDNIVGTTVQNFSQEIIQEFQLGITNNDLSTGASATGSVNVVTRSGSNKFHGNGYIYWRDSSFAAFAALNRLDAIHGIPPEVRTDQIAFDREQFGGTFSGPIEKDRLFFFANTEYNNQDAVAIRVIPVTTPGFSGFTPKPFNELFSTGRIDWKINDRMTSFLRFSHNNNDLVGTSAAAGIVPRSSNSGIFQSNDETDRNRSDGFVIGLTRTLRANLVNDLRYNFNDFYNRIDPVTKDFPQITVFNPGAQWRSGTNSLAPQETFQTRIQIRDDLIWTTGKHTLRFGGNWERTSLGGLFDAPKPGIIRLFGPFFTGGIPLVTEEDYLNAPVRDIALGVGSGVIPFNDPAGATVNHRLQFYGTDSWKLTRRFSFNYGVAYRWDSNLWNHDLGHPAIIAPLFGKGTSPAPRDDNNIAPRIGFAWDLSGNGHTVIRGGFGIYYDTTLDVLTATERADLGPPGSLLLLSGIQVKSSLLPGGDGRFGTNPKGATGFITLRDMLKLLPAVRKDIESHAFNCSFPTSIECFRSVSGPIISTEYQVPYSLQYAIGLQKQLPGELLLQADFNFRRGVHEVIRYDANFAQSVDKQGNPTPVLKDFTSPVPYADSSAFSTYRALLVRLDRRFSNGFQFTTSYTLSRFENFGGDGLGFGSGITDRNNFKKEYGPGGLDRTHHFVVSGVYDLPFFKNSSSRFKKNALGSWTVALISTAYSGLPTAAALPDMVDLTGSGSFASYLPGTGEGSIGRSVKSLGQLNAIIRNYNANRNQYAARIDPKLGPVDPYGTPLRELAELPPGTPIGGDSMISQDVRLTKSFHFGESRKLDFMAEAFNLFNIANLTNVSSGVIPAKEDTLVANYQFVTYVPTQRTTNVFGTGGPRAFQFSLKFGF
jgi:hypothetical protein